MDEPLRQVAVRRVIYIVGKGHEGSSIMDRKNTSKDMEEHPTWGYRQAWTGGH